jgi:hypothetical protein
MYHMYRNGAAIMLATALSVNTAFAGNLSDPVVTPQVIIEDTTKSSSDDWVVPFMTLLLFAAAITN